MVEDAWNWDLGFDEDESEFAIKGKNVICVTKQRAGSTYILT